MNHEMPNNNDFNSISILDWFKGDFGDYLSIEISGLENAHLDTSPFVKNFENILKSPKRTHLKLQTISIPYRK
jgi:hypothetical protein